MSLFKGHRDVRGFSLIQILVVIGIVAVLAAGFATMLVELQKEVRRMSAKQGRTLSSYQMDQVTVSPFGVKTSAGFLPENEQLKACVIGGSTSTCSSNCCQNGQSFYFYLLDPRDTNPVLSERARLGGTLDHPVYYDEAGNNSCVSPGCTYHVVTSFVPRCPGGVGTCDHAEHIVVTTAVVPEQGKEYLVRTQERTLIYFVNVNYQPFISPIANQTMTVGANSNLSVYGNSGHPSEVQNFIFQKCETSDATKVTITCYGFMNGVGTISLNAVAAGTATITLQINDGGTENALSPELTFNVLVN